jgi:hypothetical protein
MKLRSARRSNTRSGPKVDQQIDAWAVRQAASGLRIVPVSDAPWIEDFERLLPHRLPDSFRSLVTRYRFPKVAVGRTKGTELFGNLGSRDPSELVVAAIQDPHLWPVVRDAGFLPIGRPASGSYDPICLNLRKRAGGDAPVVQVDHESVLTRGEVTISQTVSPGFLDLLATA